MWYNFVVTLAQLSYIELHNDERPDFESRPWKEFIELANWHDSLIRDIECYESISDEEFHQIEVKAAYTQCIMMKHIAENLAKLKENTISH